MTKAETDLTEQHCSNRLHCSRNSKSLGIDRLTLWFPTRPGGWFNRDADDLTANLHIMSRGNRAGVDFNPSRVVDPYGTGLASTENAIEVTGEVWRVVSGHVVPRVTLALAHVTRLDVAHDFLGAMEPSQLILGLSKLRRPYQGDPRGPLRRPHWRGSLGRGGQLGEASPHLPEGRRVRWIGERGFDPLGVPGQIEAPQDQVWDNDLFRHRPRVDHCTSGIAAGPGPRWAHRCAQRGTPST